MPAAVIKGILLSVGIIAALGIAVMESPHVQAWIEEQRRKIVELLRSIGNDLDPHSRRAAEAFAFEGRTPANDESLRREATASLEAAALATGRSLSSASTVRRVPISGPADPNAAEERQRRGKEYLAQRQQKLQEMKQRDKSAESSAPSSPTTFDEMVDVSGKLRSLPVALQGLSAVSELEARAPPSDHEDSANEHQLVQPLLAEASSSIASRAWQMGSEMADPFGDEHALDRSITPRPPVPPKVGLEPTISSPPSWVDRVPSPALPLPGSFSPPPEHPHDSVGHDLDELSYEEQIAIALSLSEQENTKPAPPTSESETSEEADLRAAIANSLKDLGRHQALQTGPVTKGPLIDISAMAETITAPLATNVWSSWFDQLPPASRAAPPTARSEMSEDLYHISPRLTPALVQSHEPVAATTLAQPVAVRASLLNTLAQYNTTAPTTETTNTAVSSSGVDSAQATESTVDFSRETTVEARDSSRTRSDTSVELVDPAEDSDVDMMSEEGIATPDSWSEVDDEDLESVTGAENLHRETAS